MDADAGTERFSGYEAELKLVQADLNQQLEQIRETTGEPRKAAISKAERALEEAEELVCGRAWRRAYRRWARRPAVDSADPPTDWPDAPREEQHPRQPQVQVQHALPQL
jgi:ElaB/YqjD/DUF883 family membrane-anchored ribosome-binding protein